MRRLDKIKAKQDAEIERLLAKEKEQQEEISKLQKEIAALNRKFGRLDRPVKTSNNSSVPPSKNPIGI